MLPEVLVSLQTLSANKSVEPTAKAWLPGWSLPSFHSARSTQLHHFTAAAAAALSVLQMGAKVLTGESGAGPSLVCTLFWAEGRASCSAG